MQLLKKMKKGLRKAWTIAKARPLLRDADMMIPRIIYKTKVRGRTLVRKPLGGQRELESRKIISECTPREGKYYYFNMSKRYPHVGKMKRWEKYYDNPSLKDVLDGRINRRMIKLMEQNKLSFEPLFEMCKKGYEEMEELMYEYIARDGYDYSVLDLRPDQYMVQIKNKKPHFILIDS